MESITLHYCMYYNKQSFFLPDEKRREAYRTALTSRDGKSFESIIKKEVEYIKGLFTCPDPLDYGLRIGGLKNGDPVVDLNYKIAENVLEKTDEKWVLNGKEVFSDEELVGELIGLMSKHTLV